MDNNFKVYNLYANTLNVSGRPLINGTGVVLSGEATTEPYVTGISGSLQTQITTLNNQTGSFYPRTNPSGYITGISNLVFTTGDQIITGKKTLTDHLILQGGSNQLHLKTGSAGNTIFITTPTISANRTYTIPDIGSNAAFVLTSGPQTINGTKTFTSLPLVNGTGVILTSDTGQFYPRSNPSGFITGVNLSSYATQSYVTGISGGLQTQITSLNNQTGSYYPRTNPSGYITGVDLSFSGNYYTKDESESRYVNTTGTETILGDKTFHDRVYINNLYVTGLETIVNTTNTNIASNYIMLNLTGGAVDGGLFFVTGSGLTGINDSGAIIGFDHSDKFKFGISTRASDLSTLSTIASFQEVTGISGDLQTQISTLNNQTGSYVLNTETGNFITISQTGLFYPNSNPSGFITGIDNLVYTTGNQSISGNINISGNLTISGIYNIYQQIENAKILSIAYAIAL
jgi:hypothetical protein